MKNRDYKNFAKGEMYHVYNRGVGKMNLFEDSDDFKVFLNRLKENLFPETAKLAQDNKFSISTRYKKIYKRKLLPPNSFDLICYCLMPNHFHLLIQQLTDLSVNKLISKVCTGFSIYYNKKHNRVGSVFQDAFKAVLIENNEQLLWTSLYIHENPQKSGLVKFPENYAWSSFTDYQDLNKNTLCNRDILLKQFHSPKSYLKYFKDIKENTRAQNQMIGFQDLFIDEDFLTNQA